MQTHRRAFKYFYCEVSDMKKAASVFLRTEMTLRDVELLSQWMENPIITRYLNEMPGVSDSLRDLAGKIPAPLLALRFNQEGRFSSSAKRMERPSAL